MCCVFAASLIEISKLHGLCLSNLIVFLETRQILCSGNYSEVSTVCQRKSQRKWLTKCFWLLKHLDLMAFQLSSAGDMWCWALLFTSVEGRFQFTVFPKGLVIVADFGFVHFKLSHCFAADYAQGIVHSELSVTLLLYSLSHTLAGLGLARPLHILLR